MSELAAKLARRRALNGEGDTANQTPSTTTNTFKLVQQASSNSARVKAEQEEAARIKGIEEKEAARLKAEQEKEVARVKAEQEAMEAARVKAQQEREAARLKAEKEKEEARVKAEQEAMEAARVKAEQEAMQEEARVKSELEKEAARLKAERDKEAARVNAEQEAREAARVKAEQEKETARVKAEQEAMEEAARVKAEHEAMQEAARVNAETQRAVNDKQEKVDDELKELESFFDNMTDDMEGLGLPEPSLGRELSTTCNGSSLFAEDSSAFSHEGGDSDRQILQRENDKLKAEVTSLLNAVGAKEAQIQRLRKQIESFSRRMKGDNKEGGGAGPGGGVPSVSSNDECPVQSPRHMSYKQSRDLFADDVDVDNQDIHADEDLAGSNCQLTEQITALTAQLQQEKEVVASTQKELDNLRKAYLQSSAAGIDPSRGSMSAQVVLQSNLDSMGFQAGNIATLMEDEEDGGDSDNLFGLSDRDLKRDDSANDLDSLLKVGAAALGSGSNRQVDLDSNFWASQSLYQKRLLAQEKGSSLNKDVEGSEHAGELARQKMDTHGLFGSGGKNDVEDTAETGGTKNKAMFKDDYGGERVRKKESDAKVYHYHEFMTKAMHPDNASIASAIKNFLMSVLGPYNDCRRPPPGIKLDYEFHGMTRLAARCDDFISAIIEHLQVTPGWSGDSDERYISARDCLEKCIMTNIHKYAFESVVSPADDDALLRRMKLLSFVPASALDIKPELVNDLVFALARDELSKINSYTLPADKIACVTRCAAVIFRSLNLARAKTEENPTDSALGADDFLPMFILVVMRSQVPQLYSNCEYIQSFHSPDQMRSKAGYCFVNLRSAMEFILSATSEDLSMDAAEFDAKLKEATIKLDAEESNSGGGFSA